MRLTSTPPSRKTKPFTLWLSPEEAASLDCIRRRLVPDSPANLAAILLLLGELTYWRSVSRGVILNREQLLAAVETEQARRAASKP